MNRNYGIEILRILSMLMIILYHLLGHGGVLGAVQEFSSMYNVAWFLLISCCCAVNIYALTTGYLLINSKFKIARVIRVWTQVIFYTISITFLTLIIAPELISINVLIKSFFPTILTVYWYFTAYMGVLLLSPYLNKMLHSLTKKEYQHLLLLGFVLFSVIETVIKWGVFQLAGGYSVWWLLLMYVTGAYISLHGVNIKKVYSISLYFASILFVFLSKIAIEFITFKVLGYPVGGNVFTAYTSPFIIFAALGIFLFFEQVTTSKRINNLLASIGSTTFGVYLIHDNPIVRESLILNNIAPLTNLSPLIFLVVIILIAISIFSLCSLIEWCRVKLFNLLKVNQTIEKIINSGLRFINSTGVKLKLIKS